MMVGVGGRLVLRGGLRGTELRLCVLRRVFPRRGLVV